MKYGIIKVKRAFLYEENGVDVVEIDVLVFLQVWIFYSSAHMKKMESIQNLFYTRKDKKAQTNMICFHPSLSFIFTLLFSRIH